MKNSESNGVKTLYPERGTAKRVISGGLASILGEVALSARAILLVPLFLRAWGKVVYGEWLTIYALISYMPLIDMGMQNYVTNLLTQAYSRGNLKECSRIFQSALRLYLAIISVALLSFLIFVYLAPLNRWFNINITSPSIIKLTVMILGSYILFTIPAGLISGIYHSFGEYPRRVAITNIKEILITILLAIGLFFKYNFLVIAFLHLIPLFILITYVLLDIKHRYEKAIQFDFSRADWKLSFGFIGPGLLFMLIILANVIKTQGNILVISNVLGAGAVAIFSVHRILSNLASKLMNSISFAFCPELTATETRMDYKKMQLAFGILTKLSVFLALSFASVLLFIGRDIIRIWTRNKIEFQPVLWALLLVYLPLTVFWETCGIFQISTNKYKKYGLAKFSAAILGIIVSISLTKKMGIVGALSGFMIAEILICGVLIPSETLKIIKLNRKEFWVDIIVITLVIASLQALMAWIIAHYVYNLVIRLILLIFVTFSIGTLVIYLFFLKKEEKNCLFDIKQLIYKR